MKPLTITFRDLLDDEDVEIDGLRLYSKIRVDIRRDTDGRFEIDYWDDGPVFMMTEAYDGIGLNISAQHLLHKRFTNACELRALKMAAETPEWKWREIAEEIGA